MVILYEPGKDADMALASWYITLQESGDLEKIFTEDMSLGEFFAFMRDEIDLCFAMDAETGIHTAIWFKSFLSGAFVGVWVRSDKRQSKEAFNTILQAFENAFMKVNVIFVVTKQKELVDEHRKFGYTLIGEVPELWNGETAWLSALTKENFNGRWRSKKSSKGKQDA